MVEDAALFFHLKSRSPRSVLHESTIRDELLHIDEKRHESLAIVRPDLLQGSWLPLFGRFRFPDQGITTMGGFRNDPGDPLCSCFGSLRTLNEKEHLLDL
jgi:hypothetical protein